MNVMFLVVKRISLSVRLCDDQFRAFDEVFVTAEWADCEGPVELFDLTFHVLQFRHDARWV